MLLLFSLNDCPVKLYCQLTIKTLLTKPTAFYENSGNPNGLYE